MAEGIYKQLVEDPEFDDAIKVTTDLKQSLRDSLSCRETTLANLRTMKQEVEANYVKSRQACIGGTVATTTGSILSVMGFGLSFLTAGASLGLTVAGGVLAATGGATIAGAEIIYYIVSNNTLKNAQNACNVDREKMEKVEANGRKLSNHIESLAAKHNTSSSDIYEIIRDVGLKVGKSLYCGYKLIDGVTDAGRVAYHAVTVGKAAHGARTTLSGLKSVAGIARVTFVALEVVFLPIDLAIMVKSINDVHNYNTGQGSNSAVANEIGKLISDLEEHEQKMKENLEELESSST